MYRSFHGRNCTCTVVTCVSIVLYCVALYCIVFIHFYSASHSMSLAEVQLPTTINDTVSELTRRSAIGNCK